MNKWITAGAAVILFCANEEKAAPPPAQQEITPAQEETKITVAQGFYVPMTDQKVEHLHGSGFAGHVPGLAMATHNGLRIYQNGAWLQTAEMAVATVDGNIFITNNNGTSWTRIVKSGTVQ